MKKISEDRSGRYGASWSGGKDSCFACYLAASRGLHISHLVHFDRPENLHGVDPGMILEQARLTGIPLIQKQVNQQEFEAEFKRTMTSLKAEGITGMIFGDIYLVPHKEWIDRICSELDIEAVLPLWNMDTGTIIQEFFRCGFETIVASGDRKLIDRKWIGRRMDDRFIEYLRENKLDVCGENGEFHTFVTAGPLFKGRIEITDSSVTGRDGFWFLDVKDYALVETK
jgi:diphthine-ammonia ligase